MSSSDSDGSLAAIAWRGERVSRIMLGTVQLGLDYGIANTQGRPDVKTATAIVETAWRHGIRHFDTGQAYGTSEAVLGQALRDLGVSQEACVETKLSTAMDPTDLTEVADSIERSFELLGVERLWCMMLHRPYWLDYWDQGLGDLLRRHRDAGRIRHLGTSIHLPEEAPRYLTHPDMEVLQVPCNAWDRRIPDLGVFDATASNNQLCCVRSIYLKGLLALPIETVAERLPIAREASVRWHAIAARHGMSPPALAVRFALSFERPLVVGAESPEQVTDTIRLAGQGALPEEVIAEIRAALDPVVNDTIVTPQRWEDIEDAVFNPSAMRHR